MSPRNLVFLHIPKTAGCAVAKALGSGPRGHWPTHHAKWKERMRITEDPLTFTIVRHPLDRARSFYSFLKGLKPNSNVNPHWVKGTQGVISEVCQHMSLSDFWSMDLEWLVTRFHFIMQQSRFFKPGEIDHIIHYEKLEEGWDQLRTISGHNLPALAKHNCSERDTSEFSPRAYHNIRNFYRQDFNRFYERDTLHT